MPEKEQRAAAAPAVSTTSGDEDYVTERRPLSEPAATTSLTDGTQQTNAPLQLIDQSTEPSAPVPAGIDPLVVPLIDHLEDPKRTHMPFIRASTVAFGGSLDIALAADDIAAQFAEATGESELSALARLQADFDLTLARVLVELGPGWLASARTRLRKKRKELERGDHHHARLDPALVEAAMAEQRLEEAFTLSHLIAKAEMAWVGARQNEPAFRSGSMKRPPLDWRNFGPQREVPEEERVPVSETAPADQAGVAPELRGFLDLVGARYPGFTATNRAGHGGGKFRGAGFSVDVYLSKDKIRENGFYDSTDVVAFLLTLDRLAANNGVQWRALYNDEEVGKALSGRTARGFVTFMGTTSLGKTEMLNYHGPAPLKLHLHFDFSVRMSLPPKP
jgi:hypothetical protein